MSEHITDIDGWVDMRVGEHATVRGKLESVGFGMPGHLIILFVDWSMLMIACDLPRETKPIPLSSDVLVRVRRTEDGLDALAVWMPGCPPIALTERAQ